MQRSLVGSEMCIRDRVMESLGKRLDRNGDVVHQGIAVYGNKGSTDQHAYVQQLRDGVDNFFATFIEVLEDVSDIPTLAGNAPVTSSMVSCRAPAQPLPRVAARA